MEEEVRRDYRRTQIIDPNPDRRKHLIDLLYGFLEDRISLAELQGVSREQLFQLAEAGHIRFKHGRLDEAQKIFQGLIVLDHRNAYCLLYTSPSPRD